MKRRNKLISLLVLAAIAGSSMAEITPVKAEVIKEKVVEKQEIKENESLTKEANVNKESVDIKEKKVVSESELVSTKTSGNLKVSVLSDIHYFSPSMIKECSDFIEARSRDRKLVEESSAVLDSALEKVKQEKPDVLLISGDLTKDGELKGHKEVAGKLKKLQGDLKAEGIDLKIFVVNGNHDINNPAAKDFSTGKAVDTAKTTPSDFKNIYKDFRNNDKSAVFTPSNGQAGGLSYVVSPKEGYTIIAVDSCKYSSDSNSKGLNENQVGGAISSELKKWVVDEANKAKAKGDTVILLEHHGLVPHFDTEGKIMKDYLVEDYDSINKEFADAGIGYAFTGHMHSNDISKLTIDNGNELYDIETGSAVTYPCPTRVVNFSKEVENNKVKETVKINTKLIESINYKDTSTGKKITDLKNYSYKKCTNESFFTVNAKIYAGKFLDKIREEGGIENYLNEKLDKNVGDYVLEALAKKLPLKESEAKDIGGKLKIYYDISGNRIVIMGVSFYKKGRLYITADSIKKEVVSNILRQIDSKIINNTTYVNSVIDKAVVNALKTNIYTNGSVKKNVTDLFNEVYYANLAGEEKAKPWVTTCAANFKNGQNIDMLLNTVSKDVAAVINDNAKNLTFDADKIVSKDSGFISTIMREIATVLLGDNLADIIKLGKIDVNDKVNELAVSCLKDDKKEQIGELAYDVLMSMATDSNYTEDNNTVIVQRN